MVWNVHEDLEYKSCQIVPLFQWRQMKYRNNFFHIHHAQQIDLIDTIMIISIRS